MTEEEELQLRVNACKAAATTFRKQLLATGTVPAGDIMLIAAYLMAMTLQNSNISKAEAAERIDDFKDVILGYIE